MAYFDGAPGEGLATWHPAFRPNAGLDIKPRRQEENLASWHPAFRPNRAIEPILQPISQRILENAPRRDEILSKAGVQQSSESEALDAKSHAYPLTLEPEPSMPSASRNPAEKGRTGAATPNIDSDSQLSPLIASLGSWHPAFKPSRESEPSSEPTFQQPSETDSPNHSSKVPELLTKQHLDDELSHATLHSLRQPHAEAEEDIGGFKDKKEFPKERLEQSSFAKPEPAANASLQPVSYLIDHIPKTQTGRDLSSQRFPNTRQPEMSPVEEPITHNSHEAAAEPNQRRGGHASSPSFTRTVSEGEFWGDDEMETDWEVKRESEDRFVDRHSETQQISSFAKFSPAHDPASISEGPQISSAHVQDRLHQADEEQVIGESDKRRADSPTETEMKRRKDSLFANYITDDAAFFTQSTQSPQYQFAAPAVSDNKREEQLPLIPSRQEILAISGDIADSTGLFDDAGTSADDFFSQNQKAAYADFASELSQPEQNSTQLFQGLGFEDQYEKQNAQAEPLDLTPAPQSSSQVQVRGLTQPKNALFGESEEDNSEDFFRQVAKPQDEEDFFASQRHEKTVDGLLSEIPDSHMENTVVWLGKEVQEPSQEIFKKEDLDAVWSAALGEDDFLDEVTEDSANPASFFADDGEGFLEEDDELNNSSQEPTSTWGQLSGYTTNGIDLGRTMSNTVSTTAEPSPPISRYTPVSAIVQQQQQQQQAVSPTNPYFSSGPQFADLTNTQQNIHGQGTQTSFTSAISKASPYGQPSPYEFQTLQQPPRPISQNKVESFADKSRDGYSSPYDLPMDIAKPRRRPSTQTISNIATQPKPPPPSGLPVRSSSLSHQNQSPLLPSDQYFPSANSMPPPSTTRSVSQMGASAAAAPSLKTKGSTSSFFEELPITSKSRQHSSGRYTPQQALPTPPLGPPQQVSQPLPSQPYYQTQPLTQQHVPSSALPTNSISLPFNLQRPQRMNPYEPSTDQPVNNNMVPAATSRYSPLPPHPPQPSTAASQAKYAPSPSNPPPFLPHQPRNSSPLAQHERRYQKQGNTAVDPQFIPDNAEPTNQGRYSGPLQSQENVDSGWSAQLQSAPNQGPAQYNLPADPRGTQYFPQQPQPPFTSPMKQNIPNYASQYQTDPSTQRAQFAPPLRSQTHSPGKEWTRPNLQMNYQEPIPRPASVHDPTSPISATNIYSMGNNMLHSTHNRRASRPVNYMVPQDDRAKDPLQRWKGCPIFNWGLGGIAITSFPKESPRFVQGSTVPMVVRGPGEVIVKPFDNGIVMPEILSKFPGPLRTKGKKKDIIIWLSSAIEILERDVDSVKLISRHELDHTLQAEKLLLWKIMRAFVEHDGVLEGNPTAEAAFRAILSPEAIISGNGPNSYALGADIMASSTPAGAHLQSDPVDPLAVEQLRRFLLAGDREKAAWHAVDKRLWAHALLIASTLSRDLWKQVTQEFVQKEVQNAGIGAEPLAAVYQVFAGNYEESIDELVPLSARSGLQMVSTNTSGPARNAMDGLNRWRETLGLILSNRTGEDGKALSSLGKLLMDYGRVEAAHICHIFARGFSTFGGLDNPSTNMVLIGADHVHRPLEFEKDLEAILLSEVYEFGLSLNPNSQSLSIPHLQAYKLYHATLLAESGQRYEAQQYCDTIGYAIKASTRASLYYHASLTASLDDMIRRLQQAPSDGGSSWISKPTMEKVGGSFMKKFTSFVAGDDEDAASVASSREGAEIGPFAKIAGGTPSISRTPSTTDLYSSYNAPKKGSPNASTNTRYQPSGPYVPRSSYDQARYEPQGTSPERNRDQHEGFRTFQDGSSQFQPIQFESNKPKSVPSENVTVPPEFTFHQETPAYVPQRAQYELKSSTLQPHLPSSNISGLAYAPSPPVPRRGSYEPSPERGGSYQPSPERRGSYQPSPERRGSYQPSPERRGSYQPSPPVERSGSYQPSPNLEPYPISKTLNEQYGGSSYEPSPSLEPYVPSPLINESNDFDSPPKLSEEQENSDNGHEETQETIDSTSGYEPPTSGYEPPTSSYQPYEPEEDDDDDSPDEKPKPKKKMFGDDDEGEDEDEADKKSAASAKAQRDKEVEENFRKAAEADAKKAGQATEKKGWFGGWFGKKDPNLTPGPIRAKLGEDSSFYYDPELKKWVNKKAGATTPTPTASAPPPKGPPRPASTSSMPPPSGPPRSVSQPVFSTPPVRPSTSDTKVGPPTSVPSHGPPSSLASTAPPPRPASNMSNASSIDDLLSTAGPRRVGGRTKKKKQYVDVMAK